MTNTSSDSDDSFEMEIEENNNELYLAKSLATALVTSYLVLKYDVKEQKNDFNIIRS